MEKFVAIFNGKKIEIEAESLYAAKKKAMHELKVPMTKMGLLSVVNAKELETGNAFMFN